MMAHYSTLRLIESREALALDPCRVTRPWEPLIARKPVGRLVAGAFAGAIAARLVERHEEMPELDRCDLAAVRMRMTGGQSKIFCNDGSASTFTVRLSTDPLAGGLRLNADVTDGPLTASHAAALPTVVGQHGLCGLGGVRSASATFGAMPIPDGK